MYTPVLFDCIVCGVGVMVSYWPPSAAAVMLFNTLLDFTQTLCCLLDVYLESELYSLASKLCLFLLHVRSVCRSMHQYYFTFMKMILNLKVQRNVNTCSGIVLNLSTVNWIAA